MTKKIELTTQQAQSLYQTNPEYRTTLLAVFTDEELGIKPNWPKSWFDLKPPSGCFISEYSSIKRISSPAINGSSINIVPTEKHAKSILAFCQLSQLAHKMNDGWIPGWNNIEDKYYVYYCWTYKKLALATSFVAQSNVIHFETEEMAKFSIEHHADLWKQYYMID